MELNPNNPVTQEMRELWQKLCAVLVYKIGSEVVVTTDDIRQLNNSRRCNLVLSPKGNSILLKLVDGHEAVEVLKRAGGKVI